jgi:hypothetical protein
MLVDGQRSCEVASVYGGVDGLCGSRTANGERLNAAHRTLPFGAQVTVCRQGCVVVRVNDRSDSWSGRPRRNLGFFEISLANVAIRAVGMTTFAVRVTRRVVDALNDFSARPRTAGRPIDAYACAVRGSELCLIPPANSLSPINTAGFTSGVTLWDASA